jgi:hypothetical protein
VASFPFDLIKTDLLGMVAGNKATGQVTSERRKKPFQLARGAIEILHSTEL